MPITLCYSCSRRICRIGRETIAEGQGTSALRDWWDKWRGIEHRQWDRQVDYMDILWKVAYRQREAAALEEQMPMTVALSERFERGKRSEEVRVLQRLYALRP